MEIIMDFEIKESISKKETSGKYIFWDIDGTLAPYRFNGHVADPNGTKNGMSDEEIEEGIFLKRKPSKHMQKVVNECKAKENIIMGHCHLQKEIDDKNIWLDKYYPNIKERLLTFDNIPKYKSIINYCNENNILLKDIIFVDDVLEYLKEAEKNQIESWHVSSFFDWEYQEK
jgi:hypothetical protein